MNSQQKIINLLTMCKRAGKTVIGFDAVCDSVKNKNSDCVIIASDTSANTMKEINFICNKFSCNTIQSGITKEEFSHYLGKTTAVIAICDKGFSKRFIQISKENDSAMPQEM